jgi:hypothetical protein
VGFQWPAATCYCGPVRVGWLWDRGKLGLGLIALGCAATQSGGEGGAPGDGSDGHEPNKQTFLDGSRLGELPEKLSELGLYSDGAAKGDLHPTAHRYEPRYALWSNGSHKERFISVPQGQTVDTRTTPWHFPPGTLFFKTFRFESSKHAAETRVSVITEQGPRFYAYQWDDDGKDATLLDGRRVVKVPAEVGGAEFDHQIPSRLECRSCHESAPSPVLGFDALRLSSTLPGEDESQLEGLNEQELFNEAPETPTLPDDHESGPLALEVLGYFEGNCVHCHNGGDGPSSAFDLRHEVAIPNLVGVETTSELLHGLRVDPGHPETSVVYQALLADPENPEAQAMPPLGVQLKDEAAIDKIGQWISELE